jgi:hypothetical protein
MVSGSVVETLSQHIALENLEKRYGGKLPDIKHGYFPPDMSIHG